MGYLSIRSKGETQDVNKGRGVSGICLTSKTGDLLCHICGRKGHTIVKTACGKEIIPYYACESIYQYVGT